MRQRSAGIENEGLEQGDELFSREAFSFWHGEMLGRLPFLISESKVNHSHYQVVVRSERWLPNPLHVRGRYSAFAYSIHIIKLSR